MPPLHVIFGTGPVGRALTHELLRRGLSVRVVNRSGAGWFPDGVELIAGDAADRRFAREASSGAAVVYQCLAPPYHRWPELFPRMQAGVLSGATAAGARLVAMENVYMYGSPYGRTLTEKRPMTATTRKGRVRAEMAEELLQAHRKGNVRVAIGRASDFFGPGVTDSVMGARVFEPALRGETVNVLGDPTLPHTYSYVPDIARGLAVLGEREEALGEVWHLPGPETVTTREFVTMVFAEAGHTPKLRAAGKLALRTLGLFKPEVHELVEMMYQFEEPFVVEHGKFVEVFGDTSTPLVEAIRKTVEWYREQMEVDELAVQPPVEGAGETAESDATGTSDDAGAAEAAAEEAKTGGDVPPGEHAAADNNESANKTADASAEDRLDQKSTE